MFKEVKNYAVIGRNNCGKVTQFANENFAHRMLRMNYVPNMAVVSGGKVTITTLIRV